MEKNKKAKNKKSKKITFGRANCVQNISSIWREIFFCGLEEKTLYPTTFFSSLNQKPTKNAFSSLFSPQFSVLPKISPYISLGLMVEENIQNHKFNNLLHSCYFTSFVLSLCSSTKYNFWRKHRHIIETGLDILHKSNYLSIIGLSSLPFIS